MFWFDDKELSLGADAISSNPLKKKIKGMKINGMYLSKGNEWNGFK